MRLEIRAKLSIAGGVACLVMPNCWSILTSNNSNLMRSSMRTAWYLLVMFSMLFPVVHASAGDTSSRDTGLSGVWMAMKLILGSSTYEPQPRWVTLFEDGQVFTDMPNDGLLGFNRQASQADPNRARYWGTWSVQGSAGSIQKPGVIPTKLAVIGPDKIKLDNDQYYRSVSVTDLRLKGSWTSYGNPSDPALARLPVGKRPVISFTADGVFTDDGVFATFLKSGATEGDPRDRAGSGTYQFKDYTLILNYADGRTRHEAFTLLLGAKPTDSMDIVYIRRSRFNRLP